MRRLLSLTALLPICGLTQSTINPASPHAYGANVGWINCQANGTNGVRIGEFFLSGQAWAANLGWINLGSSTPANGWSYSNSSAADFGVNHDGLGNLSGQAWGANVGWINFGWTANLNDPNRPAFNLGTGQFSGFAYGANVGWINLGTLSTATITHPDTDGDGIDDASERQWFGNLTTAGVGTDRDGDGQSDAAEAIADTDPLNPGDFLRIISHTYTGGFTTVTLHFTTSPTRRYRLEHRADLAAGAWLDSGLGTFAPDSGGTTTRTFTFPAGNRHFFRAVAVRPLE